MGQQFHKTTTAQQDSERLIDKLILYILHARRLSVKYKYIYKYINIYINI